MANGLHPNNAQLSCIRALMVYDWIFLNETVEEEIVIPELYVEMIALAQRLGRSISIMCCFPTIKRPTSSFSVKKPTTEESYCEVVSIKRSVLIPSKNNSAIVKVVQTLPLTFNVFFDNGCDPEFTFTSQVRIQKEVVLCLPESLNQNDIFCRVFQVACTFSGIASSRSIYVDISVCSEVCVEAAVKLEVITKYGQPRPPIDMVVEEKKCLLDEIFPQSCPFFPVPSPSVICCDGVTDEVCGNFNITCDGTAQLIYSAQTGLPVIKGSVQISLEGPCPSITLIVNNTDSFTVLQGESRTFTFSEIASISLQCNGVTPCSGRYTLHLHYALPTD